VIHQETLCFQQLAENTVKSTKLIPERVGQGTALRRKSGDPEKTGPYGVQRHIPTLPNGATHHRVSN
jgi:hypothetical protein